MTAQELIEDAAKTVYASMQWAARHAEQGTPPDWVEGGNSLAQGEARGAARAIVQSRIAEVGRLTEALDDCVASLAAIRATADNPDEWALSAEHFSTVCLESLKVARAALSLRAGE